MRSVICLFLVAVMIFSCSGPGNEKLLINDQNYFELPGLNVMVFEDIYPEGHQGGVGFIQNGVRVATNGDVRLELTPGQFQPIPKVGPRTVDKENNQITVKLWYPDTAINRKGFNPIFYPNMAYRAVHVLFGLATIYPYLQEYDGVCMVHNLLLQVLAYQTQLTGMFFLQNGS